jgi:uncharacterized membrane protein YdfJ with MMPL/SSD domain
MSRAAAQARDGNIMRDAQVGLLIATPLVLVMAAVLYRAGALRLSSMILADVAAVVIAAVLFFSH